MDNENGTEEIIDIEETIDTEKDIDTSSLESFDSRILTTMGLMFALPSIALLLYGFIDSKITDKFFEYACGFRFLAITIAVCISIICTDACAMKRLGLKAPSRWWSLIPPVYLWKRSNILKQSKLTFIVFLGMHIFFLLLEIFIEIFFIALDEVLYY